MRLRPVRMRLVSGMRAHARPRFAAVLRTEDTGRARAARGEAADRGEQIRGEIDAQFIEVATTDELADERAKLVDFWPSTSVQGEHEQCENSWSPYW